MKSSVVSRAIPALLLLAGCVYFYLTVAGSPSAVIVERALHPWPDGAEYLDAAVSLVRDGTYSIHVAGEAHPPRYPFGHSSLIAAALWMGAEPAEAAYRVNQVAGGLLLAFLALMFWCRGHRLEGGLAVVLLATLPAFVVLCRSPLSEITSTLLTVLAIWLLYIFSQGAPISRGIAGGFLLGFGLCFRASSIFLFVFVLAAILARRGLRAKPVAIDLVTLGTCFGLGSLPAFIYNFATFGNPLQTGYGYWIPFWNAARAFDTKFVIPNLIYYWRELSQSEEVFTTASIYGLGQGSYLTPTFVVLAVLALFVLRHRQIRYFALAGVIYQGMMTFYFFKDARLAFPVLVLSVPLIARGLAEVWHRRRKMEVTVAMLLLVATLLGWPNSEGQAESITFLVKIEKRNAVSETEILGHFEALNPLESKVILTDMVPPYVHALSPVETIVAPLNHAHSYRYHPEVFRYGAKERARLVTNALGSGQTVWAIMLRQDIFSISSVYTAPDGYAWEIVTQLSPTSGIARLVALD